MRTVQNVIDSKINSYNYISPDALVIDALQMLNSVNLSYLVVMEDDNYKGVFCERDYTRNVILKGRSSNTTKVGESNDDRFAHRFHFRIVLKAA